jgi:DNA replication and repair protein RecF
VAIITQVHLKNFRNIPTLHWDCSPHCNLILGHNAQGKTNLLESLYFLSHTKSNRCTQDYELVTAGQLPCTTNNTVDKTMASPKTDGCLIQATVQRLGIHTMNTQLEAKILPATHGKSGWRTQFRLNQQPVKNRSQLLGQFPTVSFYSTDLLLLRGGLPQHRRHWLDAATAQLSPLHISHLSTFQKVLQHKNHLLRQLQSSHLSADQQAVLEVLNMQLATSMSDVIRGRLAYLDALAPHFEACYQQLCAAAEEKPTLHYKVAGFSKVFTSKSASSLIGLASFSAMQWETLYTERLAQTLGLECQRQQAQTGPHRDDISMELGTGLLANRFASQGQQRSLVLALKLAELALLEAHLQETPVLLLDDVMAELDPLRQQQLLQHLPPQAQVFITTTHWDAATQFSTLLPTANPVTMWEVKQGELRLSHH